MTLSNEAKIGIVVLAATIIAFLGFRFMKDEPMFSRVKLLYTTYDDVGGMSRGSTVYVNGLKVGSVRELNYKIEVDSIEVVMSITEPIPIPVGSKAMLAAPGIIGSPVIEIQRSNNNEILPWGSRLEGTKEAGLMDSFSGLADSGPAVVDSVKLMIDMVNKNLRKADAIEESDIKETVKNFKATASEIRLLLEGRKAQIDSLMNATNNTMSNISELSDSSTADVESLIENLEKFSSELDVLSQNLQESTESMNSILRKMDEGEGTMGLMLNDPSLYNNLDSLTYNLNDLILKIQENPGRYLKHMRLVDLF